MEPCIIKNITISKSYIRTTYISIREATTITSE